MKVINFSIKNIRKYCSLVNRYYHFDSSISCLFFFKGDHLLVIGGRYYDENRQTWLAVSDVELLTFDENDGDCSMPVLDEAVYNHASVTSSKGVITCGGYKNGDHLSKCVIQYNGQTSFFPSMIGKRSGFGIINVNGTLYSIGGSTDFISEPESPYTMETINLKYGTKWEQEKIPFARNDICTVNIGSKIYVTGGMGYWVREIV